MQSSEIKANFIYSRKKISEMNIVDHCAILFKWKNTVAFVMIFSSLLAFYYIWSLPAQYETKASIYPLSTGNQDQGLGDLGSPGIGKLVNVPMGPSKSDIILAILNSKDLAKYIVQKYDLLKILTPQEVLRQKNDELSTQVAASILLKKKMKFKNDKSEFLIIISSKFGSPELSLRVINAYLNELQYFISKATLTTAKRKRQFIENQLFEHRQEFLRAGKYFNTFYKHSAISESRGTLNVDLYKNSTFYDESELKNKSHTESPAENAIIRDVPQQVYYDYLSKQLEISNTITQTLNQQLELAKIEESREDIAFQTIETPEYLHSPTGPNRIFLLCAFILLTSTLVSAMVFFMDYVLYLFHYSHENIRSHSDT